MQEDAEWNSAVRQRRGQQKPIGWALQQHEIQDWSARIGAKLHNWRHDWTMHDLRDVFSDVQDLGRSRIQRNGQTPAHSATNATLRAELHAAVTHEDRTAAKHSLWQQRHAIQKEKNDHRWGTVLQNLRRGGWGKQGPREEGRRHDATRPHQAGRHNTDEDEHAQHRRGGSQVQRQLVPAQVGGTPRHCRRRDGDAAAERGARLMDVRHGHHRCHGGGMRRRMPTKQDDRPRLVDDGTLADVVSHPPCGGGTHGLDLQSTLDEHAMSRHDNDNDDAASAATDDDDQRRDIVGRRLPPAPRHDANGTTTTGRRCHGRTRRRPSDTTGRTTT